jgi:hypothetical protein
MRETVPGESTLNIEVEDGRNRSSYSSLAAFESDTALPDVVTSLTISVSPLDWKTQGTPDYLRLYFYRALMTVTGNDETLVVGAKHRLSEFLRRYQTQASAIAGLILFAGPIVLGVSIPVSVAISALLIKSDHWTAGITVLLAFGAFSVYVWRFTFKQQRTPPPIRLIVRNPPEGDSRKNFLTTNNLLLALTALLLVVAVLSWLYPRAPVESSGGATSSTPAEHVH